MERPQRGTAQGPEGALQRVEASTLQTPLIYIVAGWSKAGGGGGVRVDGSLERNQTLYSTLLLTFDLETLAA